MMVKLQNSTAEKLVNFHLSNYDKATVVCNGSKLYEAGKDEHEFCSTRRIFLYRGHIIKFEHDWHVNQAEAELEIWKSVLPEDRKYFVPIVAHGETDGYSWVAQKFIQFKKLLKYDSQMAEHIKKIEEICDRYNIGNDIFHTFSNDNLLVFPCNWGVNFDNQPLIYDWGVSY